MGFRVFTKTMVLEPDKDVDITLATVVLHNLLRTKGSATDTTEGSLDQEDMNGEIIPGDWRSSSHSTYAQPLPTTKK